MAICQSCGGIIGRDCFNPYECARITQAISVQQSNQSLKKSFDEGYQMGYHEGYQAALNGVHKRENELKDPMDDLPY